MKTHHIVFPYSIDGIFCSAIYLNKFMKDEDSYKLYPLPKSISSEKMNIAINKIKLNPLNDFLVMFGFRNNKRSDLFISNQYDSTIGYNPVFSNRVIYDPSYKSSSGLMVESINEDSSTSNFIFEMKDFFIPTINKIEKSEYTSINEIFNSTDPIMLIRAYLERVFHSDMTISRIIEMIVNEDFNLTRCLNQLKIDNRVMNFLKKDALKIKKEIVVHDCLSIVRQSRPGKYPIYSEFFVNPEIKYSVRISSLPQGVYAQVGYNKWHSEVNDVNIGWMLSDIEYMINGGGTYNVGAGNLNHDDVEKFIDDLCINLSKGVKMPDEMEKVGVDKEMDKVESKAEAMVKTGEADTIDDARKNIIKQEERN